MRKLPVGETKDDQTLDKLPAVLAMFKKDKDRLWVCAMALLPRHVVAAFAGACSAAVAVLSWWWWRS